LKRTSADELDAKLDGVGRRIKARAEDNRARLAAVDGLLVLAEATREAFGAKVKFLTDRHGELGSPVDQSTGFDLMQPGVIGWTEYLKPKVAHEPSRQPAKRSSKPKPGGAWDDVHGG
jgi:hypothetical protein